MSIGFWCCLQRQISTTFFIEPFLCKSLRHHTLIWQCTITVWIWKLAQQKSILRYKPTVFNNRQLWTFYTKIFRWVFYHPAVILMMTPRNVSLIELN
jgi:hypothetical protein